MTYTEFMQAFPTNEACMDYLRDRFYPNGSTCPHCEKPTKFHRIKGRSAYSCQFCGHQVYPTAGTIFHKSTTSLQLWFWAIYLMSSTRCGISAKQLGREIGVGYKTAWRMFNLIRTLLAEDDGPLSGKVEMDESGFGAKGIRQSARSKDPSSTKRRQHAMRVVTARPSVFAMVERGGRVRAFAVPDRTKTTLHGIAKTHVLPSSMIYTDEYSLYEGLGEHFRGHRRIHHTANVYAIGDTHTQTVEGFFGLVKTGIRGVYHSVSAKHLQGYLNEYAWRYNRRKTGEPIFWSILDRVEKDRPLAAQ
jgi:transposase